MKQALSFLLAATLLVLPAFAAPPKKPQRVMAPIRPTPRPDLRAPEVVMDLSRALPGKALAKLPSSAQKLRSLSSELEQGQPQLRASKAWNAPGFPPTSESKNCRRKITASAPALPTTGWR